MNIQFYTSGDIEERTFKDIDPNKNGIVFLGTGGQMKEWIYGITQEFVKNKIIPTVESDWFTETFVVRTNGGRTDLVFIFNSNQCLNMKNFMSWKIQFECDSVFISDYVTKYAEQHGCESYVYVGQDTIEDKENRLRVNDITSKNNNAITNLNYILLESVALSSDINNLMQVVSNKVSNINNNIKIENNISIEKLKRIKSELENEKIIIKNIIEDLNKEILK